MKKLNFLKISFPLCFAVFLASSSFSFAVDGNDLAQQNMIAKLNSLIVCALRSAGGSSQIESIDLTDYNSVLSLLSSLQAEAKLNSDGIYSKYSSKEKIDMIKIFQSIMTEARYITYSDKNIERIRNLADAFNETIYGDDEFKEKCSIKIPMLHRVDEQPSGDEDQLPLKEKPMKKKRRFFSCFSGSPTDDERPLLNAPPAYEDVYPSPSCQKVCRSKVSFDGLRMSGRVDNRSH
jgi:hypothetical protein